MKQEHVPHPKFLSGRIAHNICTDLGRPSLRSQSLCKSNIHSGKKPLRLERLHIREFAAERSLPNAVGVGTPFLPNHSSMSTGKPTLEKKPTHAQHVGRFPPKIQLYPPEASQTRKSIIQKNSMKAVVVRMLPLSSHNSVSIYQQRHTGERPYTCTKRKKAFTKNQLSLYTRKLTGEKFCGPNVRRLKYTCQL
jgi:hypothetical protein